MSERATEPSSVDEKEARPDNGSALEESPGTRSVVAEWTFGRRSTEVDDPLLSCLAALTRLLGRPTSPQALTAGLPLSEGKLTPELFARAAERAGLSARLLRRPLASIDDLVLPCVLLLRDRRAVVMVRRDGAGGVEIVLPESGDGTTVIAEKELDERYTGYAFFARPALGFLQRDRELSPSGAGIGSGPSSCANGRSMPRSCLRPP